jgi:hypothetical protein
MIAESSWISYTVTVSDPLFFTLMEKFSGQPAGAGGLITFKDSSTGAVIPAVTVVDSNGYSTTTTTGTFTYTYPYSLVAFYFSATGYTSSSSSYVIDSERTETIYLTAAEPEPDQTMFNSPHQVHSAGALGKSNS